MSPHRSRPRSTSVGNYQTTQELKGVHINVFPGGVVNFTTGTTVHQGPQAINGTSAAATAPHSPTIIPAEAPPVVTEPKIVRIPSTTIILTFCACLSTVILATLVVKDFSVHHAVWSFFSSYLTMPDAATDP